MQLTKKAFSANGKEIVVTLVKMGDTEGMFVTDVAAMLAVDSSVIRHHMTNHNLCVQAVHGQMLDRAKEQGLVSKMVRSINLVPRDTIKALVKIVNTPEAWSAYNYLWEVAESPATAAAHFDAIGKLDQLQTEVNALTTRLDESVLTGPQIHRILNEMKLALVRNNIDLSKTLKTNNGAATIFAVIMSDLKTLLYGPSDDIRKLMGWKLAPHRDFERIYKYVQTWSPTPQSKRWISSSGAWMEGHAPNEKLKVNKKRGIPKKIPSKLQEESK